MKTVAIIQARMSSTRLPGKVLMDLGGEPMLAQVIRRAQRARLLDGVVVATTVGPADDRIASFCEENGIACYRGSEDDVLDRYYRTAIAHGADVIVRLTADCPLLDPEVINTVVAAFFQGTFDYAANVIDCTFPDGLDTEVFSLVALDRTWKEARLKSEREHVTPYMRNHPEIFRFQSVRNSVDLSHLRWTVDEARDLAFVRSVVECLPQSDFGMSDVLELIRQRPDLLQLNAGIVRNEGYAKSLRSNEAVQEGDLS